MHHPPDLAFVDFVGPVAGALAFIAIMSLVREPARRNLNAILVAGAGGVYLSGGLGLWELAYVAVAAPVAYLGLRSHRFIGLGWLMHTIWDVMHHLYGDPIWPFMPTSSFGCAITDAVLAIWFFAGAPSLFALARRMGRLPAASRFPHSRA
jgi:hypothetical protein